MAIALVKAGTIKGSGTTTVTPAFGQATTAGDLLIATVSSSKVTVLTCTTPGWTQKASIYKGNCSTSVWYKENCAATETPPTFKSATSATLRAQLSEWSGAATSTVPDKTGHGSATVSPVTSACTAPDSAPTNLCIVATHWYSAASTTGTFSSTPTTFQGLGTDGSTSSKHHVHGAYRVYTAGGVTADSDKLSFTGSVTAVGWAIASFKAASGGGKTGHGTLTGAGVLSGAASLAVPSVGSLAGSGALSGVPSLSVVGAGSLSGSGTLTAVGSWWMAGGGVLSGSGVLAGQADLSVVGASSLAGSGVLVGNGTWVTTRVRVPGVVQVTLSAASAVVTNLSAGVEVVTAPGGVASLFPYDVPLAYDVGVPYSGAVAGSPGSVALVTASAQAETEDRPAQVAITLTT